MWFLLLGVLGVALKFFEIGPVATLSWWIVLIPFALAMAWWAWADWSGYTKAQVIKKARSVDPDKFDAEKDSILSEYRGSSVLERFIDPNGTGTYALPDYAATANPLTISPLDLYYQFRVVEAKRFNP